MQIIFYRYIHVVISSSSFLRKAQLQFRCVARRQFICASSSVTGNNRPSTIADGCLSFETIHSKLHEKLATKEEEFTPLDKASRNKSSDGTVMCECVQQLLSNAFPCYVSILR